MEVDYKNWKNAKKELEKIIRKNGGEFPTGKILRKFGRGDLENIIYRKHKGMNKVRKRMGYAPLSKPRGYWKNWSNVEKELKKVIKENEGEFPRKITIKRKNPGLMNGIQNFGGIYVIREKMGYESERKAPSYWGKWKNLKSELESAIKINMGRFPTRKDLRRMGLQRIINGFKYHGGARKIKKKMGYEVNNWGKWEEVRKKLEEIIEKNEGEFPIQKKLCEWGYSGLVNGIYRYHTNLGAVRKKMGYGLKIKPKGYWGRWSTIKGRLKDIIKENEGEFPTYKYLQKNHYDLLNGILRHHGKLSVVKKKMGYKSLYKPRDYWKEWRNVKRELIRAIKNNGGEFLSFNQLIKLKYSSLAGAIIKYHHGFPEVRKKMGFEVIKKPNGYLRVWDNFRRELEEIIKKNNGKFPTQKRLYGIGESSLVYSMKYHGGFPAVREKIGYNEKMRVRLAKDLEKIVGRMAA